jgi:hypothetical protein
MKKRGSLEIKAGAPCLQNSKSVPARYSATITGMAYAILVLKLL